MYCSTMTYITTGGEKLQSTEVPKEISILESNKNYKMLVLRK